MIHLHADPIAITFTAGVDSTVLAYWVAAEADKYRYFHPELGPENFRPTIHLIACNYGQKNWHVTWKLLKLHADILQHRFGSKFIFKIAEIKVPMPDWSLAAGAFVEGFKPPEQVETPNPNERSYGYALIDGRNAMLFSWMLSYCSHHKIGSLYTGHQYEHHEWRELDGYQARTEDFSPMFIDRMNLLQECGFKNRVRINAPFFDNRMSKYNIATLGKELKVDVGLTYSCQFLPPCGKCDGCVIRRKVFGLLNIEDKSGTYV